MTAVWGLVVGPVNQRDRRVARRENARFVVVRSSSRRPPWLAGWTRVRLAPDEQVYAYLPGSLS